MTLCRTSKFRYWGQQIHDQAVQVLHYLLTIYSVLTAGTHKYVKDTIDAKNAKQMFRFGPAVKKKEGNLEVFTPLGLVFHVFAPLFRMYLSPQYWYYALLSPVSY